MRISIPVCSILILTFCNAAVLAEKGVAIEPGEWEMTSTTTSNTLDAANVQTVSRCIELSEITARDLTPSRGECELTDTSSTEDTLNWKVACDMTVGTMQGVGNFTSNGDSGSGKMLLDMNVQNDQFKMEVVWEARRVGDCQ